MLLSQHGYPPTLVPSEYPLNWVTSVSARSGGQLTTVAKANAPVGMGGGRSTGGSGCVRTREESPSVSSLFARPTLSSFSKCGFTRDLTPPFPPPFSRGRPPARDSVPLSDLLPGSGTGVKGRAGGKRVGDYLLSARPSGARSA